MHRRISVRNLFVLAGGLLLASLFAQCHSSESKAEKEEEESDSVAAPAPTEVFALTKGKLASSLNIPGELIAYRDVDIYAKVSGFIKTLNADVGSEVREGQLLAQAEAPELSAQLASADSKLKAQEALSIASKANYERVLEASKFSGAVSKNDVDQALAKRNADLAQLEAAKSAYREVATLKNYLAIRAPFDGIISARNASTGAYIGPAGKGSEFPLFVLTEQKRLRLVVAVPEAYTGYVHEGSEVSFTVKTFPNRTFTGKIKRLSGALDKRLRSERVEVDVINSDKKLLPGMVAEVTLPLPTQSNTFIVPKAALVNSTTGVFVIRVKDGKSEWVSVKKGLEADNKIEIFGDLNEGDQLVSTASEEIRDGAPVNVK
ncbi:MULTISPECIES: efflux RND transporter periplasmic adaptor subunit [unclassified Spirosoma]|uniref:efflux RND transporter periplasmic adaptor subunit n=1 Tax=unclassified Spirosoma TaxID=2621999 RepID=UPI000967E7E9|nr:MULTISPECIES: efflux RND transporter periplasmic adaptor subunit [unclassified Spirosoma]MBN8822374.1 efflux RND transporter periplasmic adaptor subunit [Spirosoma sp.]OJW72329.1 MAG: efflux transporter periplasmic adaptor subunit [Spirosoma sp. 48-14]